MPETPGDKIDRYFKAHETLSNAKDMKFEAPPPWWENVLGYVQRKYQKHVPDEVQNMLDQVATALNMGVDPMDAAPLHAAAPVVSKFGREGESTLEFLQRLRKKLNLPEPPVNPIPRSEFFTLTEGARAQSIADAEKGLPRGTRLLREVEKK